MYTDTYQLYELIENFLGLLICLVFSSGFVIILLKVFSKKTLSTDDKLSFLRELKSQGIESIDEGIEKLIEKNPLYAPLKTTQPKPIKSVEEPKTAVNKDITVKTKENVELFTPQTISLLLYLGAGLFTFAIFILVAFNWETFPDIVKGLILIFTTFVFYTLGIVLVINKKLRQAGHTFIIVASIMLGFTGIGLWNFGVKNLLGNMFEIYWLFYSIFLTLVYLATTYILNKRTFFNLSLIAIYSLIISLSFTLTDDRNFRIVVIAFLNLLLYLFNFGFVNYTQSVKIISRVVNQILNIFIMLLVASLVNQIDSDLLKITAIIALFVPTIFEMSVQIIDKSLFEPFITRITLPIKLFIIYLFLQLSIDGAFILFTSYIIFITLVDELFFENKKLLWITNLFVNWLISGILSLLILLNSFVPNDISLNSFVQIYSLTIILFISNIFHIIKKRYTLLSLTSLYLIFFSFKIINLLDSKADFSVYTSLFIALNLLSLVFGLLLRLRQKSNLLRYIIPFYFVTAVLSLITSLTKLESDYLHICFAFLIIGISIELISYLFKFPYIKAISPFLNVVSYFMFMLHLSDSTSLDIEKLGLISLIPAVIYAVRYEFEFKKKDYSSLIGFMLFSLIAFMLTLFNPNYLFVTTLFFILYSIYVLLRYRIPQISYVSFVFFIILSLTIGDIFNLSSYHTILMISFFMLIFAIIERLVSAIIKDDFYSNIIKSLDNNIYIWTIILLLFSFEKSLGEFNIFTITSNIVIFITLVSLNKIKSYNYEVSGLALLFTIWNLVKVLPFELNIQFFIAPLSIYLIGLITIANWRKNHTIKYFFEYLLYFIQFGSLYLQSIFDENEIYFGLVLILLTSLGIIFAQIRRNKVALVICTIFLVLELIARLYGIILTIPWWIYLALFGCSLMLVGLLALIKIKKT